MSKKMTAVAAIMAAVLAVSIPALCQTAQDFILKGDEFYAQFDDKQALESYLQALKVDPNHHTALWKTARAYVDLGDLLDPAPQDLREQQLAHYQNCRAVARHAREAVAGGY